MKIDQMTKQQVVLLCLLIGLVTSIATGSTVVSLTSQNQQPVVQTVNRIIEKTVETIIPTVTEKEKEVIREVETIIVREDDAVTTVIEKNRNSIVRVFSVRRNRHLSNAAVVSADGKLLSSYVNDSEEIRVVLANGVEYNAHKINDVGDKLSVLQIDGLTTQLAPLSFSNEKLKLGQALVSLGGQSQDYVSSGILASINEQTNYWSFTSSNSIDDNTLGSVVFDIFGKLVGIRIEGRNYLFVKDLPLYLVAPVVIPTPNNESSTNTNNGTTGEVLGTSTEETATDTEEVATSTESNEQE